MRRKTTIVTTVIVLLLFVVNSAHPCSRVLFKGEDEMVMTARTMDWDENMEAQMWVYPRGLERGGSLENSVEWTSKYGSVTISGYNLATIEGMNEKGLVTVLNWLHESEFPEYDADKAVLTVGEWVQYLLDNFATVEEIVKVFEEGNIQVLTSEIPGTDLVVNIHVAVSDRFGDSAIFEYDSGELQIYHSPSYNVMTNSPFYKNHLVISDYFANERLYQHKWSNWSSTERFIKAKHLLGVIPKDIEDHVAVASIFGVTRLLSLPYNLPEDDDMGFTFTVWRSLCDQKNLTYYFESYQFPTVVWVNFAEFDFSVGSPVRSFDLFDGKLHCGSIESGFVESEPFELF